MRALRRIILHCLFITLLLEQIRGHARYTIMDGYVGYNQIAIVLGDVHKMAFNTPWGTFVMPFGLCNATATIQQLDMYIFTYSLFKSITMFIDVFRTQSNSDDNLECVRLALVRCRTMRLALNPDETFLGIQRGGPLSYVGNGKGRAPDPEYDSSNRLIGYSN